MIMFYLHLIIFVRVEDPALVLIIIKINFTITLLKVACNVLWTITNIYGFSIFTHVKESLPVPIILVEIEKTTDFHALGNYLVKL